MTQRPAAERYRSAAASGLDGMGAEAGGPVSGR